jgi:hypothetical protein
VSPAPPMPVPTVSVQGPTHNPRLARYNTHSSALTAYRTDQLWTFQFRGIRLSNKDFLSKSGEYINV